MATVKTLTSPYPPAAEPQSDIDEHERNRDDAALSATTAEDPAARHP